VGLWILAGKHNRIGIPAYQAVVARDESDGETATYRAVTSGLPAVIAGIKSLLDTGEPLAIPQ
jgi:hypothetical protein